MIEIDKRLFVSGMALSLVSKPAAGHTANELIDLMMSLTLDTKGE